MKITRTFIEGLLIVQPGVFPDERGYFFESFNRKLYSEAGIAEEFVQDNQSCSQKGVLRGLHFQNPPFAQSKLLRVVQGAIWDVAVDIRKSSPTYGSYFAIELSTANKTLFYVPKGFAHGFLTLEENSVLLYKCSEFYNKASEDTLVWNDPDINIDWKITNPLLSEKDRNGKKLKDLQSLF